MLPGAGDGFLQPQRLKKPQKPYVRKIASSTTDFDCMRAAEAKRRRRHIANLELVASGQMSMRRLKPKTSIDVSSMQDLERLEQLARQVTT